MPTAFKDWWLLVTLLAVAFLYVALISVLHLFPEFQERFQGKCPVDEIFKNLEGYINESAILYHEKRALGNLSSTRSVPYLLVSLRSQARNQTQL